MLEGDVTFTWQRCWSQEDDGKEAHLKYMKKCSGDLYMWPNPIDESWEPTASIICTVGYPELVNKREQFQFSATDMAKVQ